MRVFVITLAGAIGGAVLGVVAILTLAQSGMLPINDRQMQTYLMHHPELAPAMMGRAQQLDDLKQKAAQAESLRKIGQAAFFDPKLAFVTGPADAKKTLVEFYDYDCPYCRASLPAIKKYYEAHKNDTRFAFIEMPIESLQRTFPQHVKIGPVEQIAQLVNSALPGITVRALSVVPRQLPYKASTCYFELDRTGPFWRQLQRPGGTGGLAIHVGRDLPEVDLELWAIKG